MTARWSLITTATLLAATLLSATLAGCSLKDAFAGHQDVVAMAVGQEPTAEHVASMIARRAPLSSRKMLMKSFAADTRLSML